MRFVTKFTDLQSDQSETPIIENTAFCIPFIKGTEHTGN